MKKLLISLIAITMTLGVACKKSEVENSKPQIKIKKTEVQESEVEWEIWYDNHGNGHLRPVKK